MAKRGQKQTPKPVTPKKVATPEKPKSDVPSAIQVNPSYDEMPDTIEDPAAVFRLAMLEMKRVAINNKLALIAQEHEKRVVAAMAARDHDLRETKAALQEAEKQFVAQKQAIEAQYGISLRSYTYNDETGVLKKKYLPEEEAEKEVPPTGGPVGDKNTTIH